MDDFVTIGFTRPEAVNIKEESEIVIRLLESGAIDFFHIRKLFADNNHIRNLINLIPANLHQKLILHSNFKIFPEFKFGGIHLKPESADIVSSLGNINHIKLTRSCHNLEEIERNCVFNISKDSFSYNFLSPIFDSISKHGYKASIDMEREDFKKLIENKRIIALGGVKPENFKKLYKYKFAGAALLGYLWAPDKNPESLIRELKINKSNLK